MLSDEEKNAIEELEKYRGISFKGADILLNLIKKQSKEIEELKANNGYHLGFIDGGIAKRYEYEDKIKAKIEEINKEMLNEENSLELFYRKKYCKEVLQSLLEKE